MDSNSVNVSPFKEAGDGSPRVVASVDPFDSQPLLNQLQFRPDTITSRLISPIQVLSTVLTSGASVPDGLSVTNVTLSSAVNGEAIIQSVASQIYIGFIDPANRMPESISSSIYPHYAWESLDDGSANSIENDPSKVSFKRQVRNNSGATQTIIFKVLVKYIVNKADNAAQG